MPKKVNKIWGGRNGRGNLSEEKHYFGHDDRGGRSGGSHLGSTKPRVSFKTHRINREIPRNLALASLDEDIPMTGNSNNNTRQVIVRERDRSDKNWQRRISQGRNSPLPNRNFGKGGPPGGSRLRQFPLGECSWYRVYIPYGHKYEKDYVLRTLLNYMAPDVFVPIMYKVMENEASFYIDDYKVANTLQNCDRKITMTDGFKLQIRVKPSSPSFINDIDEKLKERLKQAMSKRYVQETNALDLSKFHQDSDLVDEYFYALFRTPLLMVVLDIVVQHIPDLEALNLEGNKLNNIDKLNVLSKKFPKLKILYIGDNKITNIHQLDVIKDLKLDELRLTGNPVCNKYKSRQSDYISDVRKRFPKLLRLDGMELPRPIVFDVVDEAAKVPPSQRMFVADAKAQEIASQFLQQYFAIFDRENRQPLLDAYNEHACFSMTITASHVSKLNGYLIESRNLFRINDTIRRQKLLKQGKLPIVSFISQMPQTRHFVDTFTMDIALAMQAMMFITITGYFQEINTKEQPIRHFNRTFVIVPEGSGYCICNEQLHISQPSETQLKQLHQQLNSTQLPQTQSQAPALLEQQLPTETAKPMASELNENIKQQMTVTLSQQTNMNLEWSLKCLQETNWNYDNALSAFQEFFKRGQIPPEAFAK
ncbi:nuclear RNA export factor 1 [Linepithema humile]|uniref:nuclear RNA export factor 1 n=1 Tax=Linepithema humile TaxID=83485 RepID=UPI0006231791|nr:PREDICTED: nuclear RNA export factor 1 [Linepithema humile]